VRVFELYRRLADRVDATVITGNYPGARDGLREGVRYEHLGAPRPYAWSRLSYALNASHRLKQGDYDVAVFDFSAYTPLVIPTNRPVAITVHHLTGPTAKERWGRVLGGLVGWNERRTLRRTPWFTATAQATFAELGMMMPQANIHLVQAGVPDDLFELPRRDEGYLLYFGRLDWYQKGLDTLLEAISLVLRDHPGLRVIVAGRGKDTPRVEAEIARLGLAGRIEIAGPVDEDRKRSLLARAAMLLMPSRFEGFGMVAAEAMAAGVPVVGSNAGSLPEVVAPPDGGVLVPVGAAQALADAVNALLRDPEERKRMSESARRSAERFRWSRVAADHLQFLEEVARSGSNSNLRSDGQGS
jgi:glycosyltransferase involved in cell wall biosynthesis